MAAFSLDDVLQTMTAPAVRGSRYASIRPSPLRRASVPIPQIKPEMLEPPNEMISSYNQIEATVEEVEFKDVVKKTQSYKNLHKALNEWCLRDAPPFAELLRYAYKDQTLNLKRDDHILSVWVHHTSKKQNSAMMGYKELASLVGHYNHNGKKMQPKKLRVAIIRQGVKDLRMRDSAFSPNRRFTSRQDTVISQSLDILNEQLFAQDDDGMPLRKLFAPDGRDVRQLVKKKAEEILAAVPPESSICTSTIAKWAVWHVCVLTLNFGPLRAGFMPSNHPHHSLWLQKLGCHIVKRRKRKECSKNNLTPNKKQKFEKT